MLELKLSDVSKRGSKCPTDTDLPYDNYLWITAKDMDKMSHAKP